MKSRLIIVLTVLVIACCGKQPRATVDLKPQGQQLDPRTLVLLQQARGALANRDFEEVTNYLEQAEHYNRGIPEVRFLRGHVALALSRLPEARAAFEGVLAQYPTYGAAWHGLGDVAYAEGKFTEALRHYFREIEHNPTPQTWYNVGNAYRSIDKPDSARASFEKSISLDPSFPLPLHSLAELDDVAGDYGSALVYARRALTIDPQNYTYQYLVGTLLFRLGRLDEADEMLRSALDGAPWDYSTLYSLGQVLQRQGRTDEAEEMLRRAADARRRESDLRVAERAARQSNQNAAGHVQYASELIRAGRLDEALDRFRMALALDPSDLTIRQNIAALHLQKGHFDEAISICSEIVRKDSARVGAWVILSASYARLGSDDRSREAWHRALAIDPNHPTVQQALGRR